MIDKRLTPVLITLGIVIVGLLVARIINPTSMEYPPIQVVPNKTLDAEAALINRGADVLDIAIMSLPNEVNVLDEEFDVAFTILEEYAVMYEAICNPLRSEERPLEACDYAAPILDRALTTIKGIIDGNLQ